MADHLDNDQCQKWHKFVHNEKDIERFANVFEIKSQHLAMGVGILTRRKYLPTTPKGTKIWDRVIVTGSDKFLKKFTRTVRNFETRAEDIPDEAFAIYALIEPKNTVKALSKTMNECVTAMTKNEETPDAYELFHNTILKIESSSDEKYLQIVLDTKEPTKVKIVRDLLIEHKVPIVISIETFKGFHIIYTNKHKSEFGRKLHDFKVTTCSQKLNDRGEPVTKYWFSIMRHPNVVVPGTIQRGFPARIISLDDWLLETNKT